MVSKVLTEAYANTEYGDQKQLSFKEVFDNKKLFHVFFIVPTIDASKQNDNDSLKQLSEAKYNNIVKTPYELVLRDGRYLLALQSDKNKIYEDTPYIVIYQTFNDHFQDKNLLPPNLGNNLSVLTNETLNSSKNKLAQGIDASLLTSLQYSHESELNSFASIYLALKRDLELYSSTPDDSKTISELINDYVRYKNFVFPNTATDQYFGKYYYDRFSLIKNNVENLAKNMPSSSLVDQLWNNANYNSSNNKSTFEESEKTLKEIQSAVNLIDIGLEAKPNDPFYLALHSSVIYLNASMNILLLESKMYSQFFLNDVNSLKISRDCGVNGKSLRDKLKNSLSITSCASCKKSITSALNIFNASCPEEITGAVATINTGSEAATKAQSFVEIAKNYDLSLTDAQKKELEDKSKAIQRNLQSFIKSTSTNSASIEDAKKTSTLLSKSIKEGSDTNVLLNMLK